MLHCGGLVHVVVAGHAQVRQLAGDAAPAAPASAAPAPAAKTIPRQGACQAKLQEVQQHEGQVELPRVQEGQVELEDR